MLMQKKVLAATVVAAFAALPTLAMAQARGGNSDLGFYAGASVGQSKSDCPSGGSSCDDKDTAYRIFGGYKFHPNIAVEGGYAPLGETSTGVGTLGNVTAEANDAKTSTALNPKRLISGVVAGLIPILPTKTAATMTPAFSGSQPNPAWNIRGNKKGTELMVSR